MCSSTEENIHICVRKQGERSTSLGILHVFRVTSTLKMVKSVSPFPPRLVSSERVSVVYSLSLHLSDLDIEVGA